jgi:hypothetical protein
MPSLAAVIGGKVSGRASDKQTSWFLNLGVRGNSPQSARLFTTKQRKRALAEKSPPNGLPNRLGIDRTLWGGPGPSKARRAPYG